MKASDRRKAMKDEMRQRQEESNSRKDDSGKFRKIYIEGVLKKSDFWKSTEGEHSIDIIPYIAGANNPHVKEGKPAYILDVWVHRKVGLNEDDFICLNKTYNEPCPICEYQAELMKQRKRSDDPESFDDEIKALNPTRRAIYNVSSHDKKDDPDELKVWDISHFLFEKELLEAAKKKRGGGFVLFADPDDGKIISFRQVGEKQQMTFKAFEFEDREDVISDEMLEKARCLEELITIPSYEEVKKAFLSSSPDAPEDEPVRETRSRREAPKEEPKEERRDKLDKETKLEPKKEEVKPEPEDVRDPNVCPYDYEFGSDNNKFDECESCDCFDECSDEFRRLRRASREVKKEEPKKEEAPPPAPRTRRRSA